MSVASPDGSYALRLSPSSRGAPDSLREPLEELLRTDADLAVASQQVADRGVVAALADVRSARRRSARVFVESDYLTESTPLPPAAIWSAGGHLEDHRQCFSALSRAGVGLRADLVGGALQHVNLVITRAGEGPDAVLFTSANLAPDSIDTHLNWSLEIRQPAVTDAAHQLFDAIWDGDFRDAQMAAPISEDGEAVGVVVAGAAGEAVDEAVAVIQQAQQRIRFAYFTMSRGVSVTGALVAAAGRGVDVAGIVDADQGLQAWNGVPQLREGGVDTRYYPGALTGGPGRMHHKTLAVDSAVAHLSTANASQAATRSFELGVTLRSRAMAKYVDQEIVRLGQNSSTTVLRPL